MAKNTKIQVVISAAALAEATKLRIPTPPCGSRHKSAKDYSRRDSKRDLRRLLKD